MKVLATIGLAAIAASALLVSACGGTEAKPQDQSEVREPDQPKPPEPPEPKPPTPAPPDTGDPPPEKAPTR